MTVRVEAAARACTRRHLPDDVLSKRSALYLLHNRGLTYSQLANIDPDKTKTHQINCTSPEFV